MYIYIYIFTDYSYVETLFTGVFEIRTLSYYSSNNMGILPPKKYVFYSKGPCDLRLIDACILRAIGLALETHVQHD